MISEKENIKKNYDESNSTLESFLSDINKIVITSDNFEGNCFYYNKTFDRKKEFLNKQLNLYWVGKQNLKNICEIGFNAGHSTFLLLLGNENKDIHFTIFDINSHPYTNQCLEYIFHKYQHVDFEFVEGDSITAIPEWLNKNKKYEFYDLVHIDGGHALEIITNDLANSIKILRKGGILIIDDVHKEHINNLVDIYLSTGVISELTEFMFETTLCPHRIFKKTI
jgi:hypothetical protein